MTITEELTRNLSAALQEVWPEFKPDPKRLEKLVSVEVKWVEHRLRQEK